VPVLTLYGVVSPSPRCASEPRADKTPTCKQISAGPLLDQDSHASLHLASRDAGITPRSGEISPQAMSSPGLQGDETCFISLGAGKYSSRRNHKTRSAMGDAERRSICTASRRLQTNVQTTRQSNFLLFISSIPAFLADYDASRLRPMGIRHARSAHRGS
jgi:hypothetical protein